MTRTKRAGKLFLHMKQYRLNPLFNARSNRCFDVAVDHRFFDQPGYLQAIKDMRQGIKTLVDAAPDAIQLTVGQACHLQEIPGRVKPSLVLRTDVAQSAGRHDAHGEDVGELHH